MLHAEHISLTLAGRTILDDVSVEVPAGTSLAIVGASGSGKTTLLNLLSLVVPLQSGTLTIGGRDYTHVRDRARRAFWATSAAFVLQDYGLIEDETAAYNVMLSRPPLRKRSATTDARALAALASVGLDDRAASPVAQLSGGEKQRVSIARAAFKDAEIVFADEPTASLDRANSDRVRTLLLEPTAKQRTVVISTHDRDLASRCDRTLELSPTPVAA